MITKLKLQCGECGYSCYIDNDGTENCKVDGVHFLNYFYPFFPALFVCLGCGQAINLVQDIEQDQ